MACYVGDKHQSGDGVIAGDELIVLTHVLPDAPGNDGGPVYLGHLVVEPRRHIPGLADLAADEAAPLGGNAEVTQLVGEIRARLDVPGGGR